MINMPKFYLAVFFLFAFAGAASAQGKKQLSLNDAWQLAFHNYPGLKQSQQQIATAQLRKTIENAGRLPQVHIQAQNTIGTLQGTSGAFFPLPGIFNVSGDKSALAATTVVPNFYSSAVAEMPVISFGKINKAVKAADVEIQKAKSETSAYQLQLQAKVTRQYFDLLYAKANLTWADSNATRVEKIVGLAKSLADAGLKPGADTALAVSAYLQALAKQYDWRGRMQASQVALTETVSPLQAGDFDVPLNHYLQTNVTVPAFHQTVTQHPYLDVYRDDVEVSKALEKVAASKAAPDISILAGYGARGSGAGRDGTINTSYSSGFDNMSGNYLVGVGLTWNITGLYTSALQKKRIETEVRAKQYGYNRQELELNSRLGAASVNLQQQVLRAGKTRQAVLKAKPAYELYVSRYQNGLLSLTELLQIQQLLQDAEKVNIDTQQQLWDQLITEAELSGDFKTLVSHF